MLGWLLPGSMHALPGLKGLLQLVSLLPSGALLQAMVCVVKLLQPGWLKQAVPCRRLLLEGHELRLMLLLLLLVKAMPSIQHAHARSLKMLRCGRLCTEVLLAWRHKAGLCLLGML